MARLSTGNVDACLVVACPFAAGVGRFPISGGYQRMNCLDGDQATLRAEADTSNQLNDLPILAQVIQPWIGFQPHRS